jgi:hypothetical protein
MTKIEIIDINEFYNFVIDDLFNWNNWLFQNYFKSLLDKVKQKNHTILGLKMMLTFSPIQIPSLLALGS